MRSMLGEAERQWVDPADVSREQKQSLKQDLQAIEHFVQLELTRNSAKGLAIFTCSGRRFWQVYQLPVPVPSTIVAGREPYAKLLTAVLDEYKRFCTVVVDRRRSRIFTVYLGQIEEHLGVFEDEVPQRVNEGEWAGLRQSRIAQHIEDHLMHHLKKVADTTMAFFQRHGFDRLILASHRDILPKFKECLHPYLQERVAGQFYAQPDAPLREILERSLAVETEVQANEETRLVSQIRNQATRGGQSVLGLEPTAEALRLGQVHTLAIAEDYTVGGRICRRDRFVSTAADTCPMCGQPLAESPDVAEDMVQFAISTNSMVEHIRHVPDFMEHEKIGAILRYKQAPVAEAGA